MNNFTLQIREIIEFAKVLKADIIYIVDNIIYGTDENFTYLKKVQCNNTLNITMCYKQNDMNKFIKAATLDITYIDGFLHSNVESVYVLDTRCMFKIMELNGIINRITMVAPSLTVNNVRGVEEFEYAINLKSAQGISMYRVSENYILSLFKNLLPINKKDNVSLNIIDIDDYKFLSRFNISKTKNVNICVDIVYLKIK